MSLRSRFVRTAGYGGAAGAHHGGEPPGADGPGNSHGARIRSKRRGGARAHRDCDQPGYEHRLHGRDERGRELHHDRGADWGIRHLRRDAGLQGSAVHDQPVRGPDRARRFPAGARHADRARRGRLDGCRAADRKCGCWQQAGTRSAREATGRGSEPVGRHIIHRWRGVHESRSVRHAAGRRSSSGQRSASAGQQLHGRWHRLERSHQQPDHVPAEP